MPIPDSEVMMLMDGEDKVRKSQFVVVVVSVSDLYAFKPGYIV